MKAARRLRLLIREALSNPYQIGRAPGQGFGTGLGGFNLVQTGGKKAMGGYPGKHGGNTVVANPIKPYTDEVEDWIDSQRTSDFTIAKSAFDDSMNRLKQDIQLAGSIDKLLDIIMEINPAQGLDVVDDIVEDRALFDAYVNVGNIVVAKNMLIKSIDRWSREIVAAAASNGADSIELERNTYKH